MEHAEMVALIRGGVPMPSGVWADLGAGTGNFTWALRELLGAQGTIYAVDRDGRAIDRQRAALAQAATPGATILPGTTHSSAGRICSSITCSRRCMRAVFRFAIVRPPGCGVTDRARSPFPTGRRRFLSRASVWRLTSRSLKSSLRSLTISR